MDFRKQQSSLDLCGEWSFAYCEDAPSGVFSGSGELARAGYQPMPCRVPGNFELDLHANGIVGEPFYGMNIAHLTRYERAHVWYYRTFQGEDLPGHETQLVFEGIDCFCDLYLNGELLGRTSNMLVEYIFDVTGKLREENELFIHISPAVEAGSRESYPPGVSAIGNLNESIYTRKAAHMYGWDIMPRAVSAGIWRPVTLRHAPIERMEYAFLDTIAINRGQASLEFRYGTKLSAVPDGVYEIEVEGVCGESSFSSRLRIAEPEGRQTIEVENPKLWWVRGRGEQNLYDVTARLLKNGEEIDSLTFTHGIRRIELLRTSTTDAQGSGEFCFKLNGERIFVLGTNWVPADAYHSRDAERIPAILDMVEDLGCNAVRCWGGNVYENNLFYEICDRKGIMVWQDFAMACCFPPQDEEHQRVIADEARQVVRRVRQHPCIILWSGDNENDIMFAMSNRDPNANVLTRKVLPGVLAEENGSIPYIPSSPYLDEKAFRVGWENAPENHPWGPRDYYKSEYYRNVVCHFASEMGYHGCPSPESIRKFISPEKVWPYTDNEEWTLHCTDPIPGRDLFGYRVELMANQVRALFGTAPDNLEDYSYASQACQAEAKKFFVELFRTGKWRRTGIIWWNVMDGWPQFSDAIVDYYFSRKLAYDYIKRSQRPVLIAMREPVDGAQQIVACNDTRNDVDLTYQVRDAQTGDPIASGSATARADAVTVLNTIAYSPDEPHFYTIEWNDSLGVGKNHYLAGTPPFDLNTYRLNAE